MKKLIHVVGARPNFIKAAPVLAALARRPGISQKLVHTGQHYDTKMSEIFFEQLGLPRPDVNLEVGSGSHAVQTAQVMLRFEEVVLNQRPDLVLLYGDVNSTVAVALVCAKLCIPVAHVEAGLRSGDRTMPEEINRLLTDQIADLLFTPSADGDANLLREGIAPEKIHLVGNVMIDTLVRLLPQAEAGWPYLQRDLQLETDTAGRARYALVTLHRPSNVDEPARLREIAQALQMIAKDIPVIFPVHPRTRQRLHDLGIGLQARQLQVVDPIGYLDFLALQRHATLVITDSGGIQEETTFLDVPCLTVRENTERPITVTHGTNLLVGQDMQHLAREIARILDQGVRSGQIPPLWDGQASERIADVIAAL
jgi:UDP-N-acetylglucosamine 2-epimerase (non-hydrolysing)